MNKLLILMPLLFGVIAPSVQAGERLEVEAPQTPIAEETRTVTLLITGMT